MNGKKHFNYLSPHAAEHDSIAGATGQPTDKVPENDPWPRGSADFGMLGGGRARGTLAQRYRCFSLVQCLHKKLHTVVSWG